MSSRIITVCLPKKEFGIWMRCIRTNRFSLCTGTGKNGLLESREEIHRGHLKGVRIRLGILGNTVCPLSIRTSSPFALSRCYESNSFSMANRPWKRLGPTKTKCTTSAERQQVADIESENKKDKEPNRENEKRLSRLFSEDSRKLLQLAHPERWRLAGNAV